MQEAERKRVVYVGLPVQPGHAVNPLLIAGNKATLAPNQLLHKGIVGRRQNGGQSGRCAGISRADGTHCHVLYVSLLSSRRTRNKTRIEVLQTLESRPVGFGIEKEEQLVRDQWSSQASADMPILGHRIVVGGLEEWLGVRDLVTEQPKEIAVELIPAGFCNHVDMLGQSKSKFRIKRIAVDLQFLDGVRRDVCGPGDTRPVVVLAAVNRD